MSSPPSSSAPELQRLQAELDEQRQLVQQVRRDLIQAQITVLELNDAVLVKETEKTDAIALLAQLETVLEGKVNRLAQLDQELNRQIATLRGQLAAETAERSARDQIIQDLVQKLDRANRETGEAHTLAAGFARERDETRATLEQTRGQLAQTAARLEQVAAALERTEQARAALQAELERIQRTRSWRWTKPFRTLAGLFG